ITLEDPIEYVHEHKRSIVHQREVGADAESFRKALRFVSRQDPDVILIGEMRDRETVEAALTVAETGHLTFATLHTNSCAQTISRILDIFPTERQPQVRTQLSMVLEGVLSQRLLRRRDGDGRVLAVEQMIPNAAIRHMIREGKDHQLYGAMQCGQGRSEMRTMNQSLVELLKDLKIDLDEALAASSEPEQLEAMVSERMLGGIRVDAQEAMMARTRRLSGARGEAAEPAASLRRASTIPTVGGRP
ncbi:MAG: Flp pilus assembly complex ATPase component TadA, partial [Myxococcales bacterium]|nr:Flp pilus assembly complex ATPase component TadA [Myxococcales bacterium]